MSFRDIFADTRPLQVPAYRRLWTANIATTIGAQLTVVAVPVQIYAITGSSAYVGLTGLFGLVPLVIFGLYGGSIADGFDKRKVLVVSTLGMILTALAFWGLSVAGNTNVWWLLSVFALQQAFFAVNQPTRTAVFRSILPLEQLPAGSSLNMMLMQFGAIVGPLIAGALIPLIGFSWLYALDAALLIPTLGAVLALPSLPPSGQAQKAGFRSVVDGLSYLWTQPILLVAMLLDLIAMTFGMPRALYPEIAAESFGESGDGGGGMMLALLYSSMAAGAVLGGLLSGWVSRVVRQGLAVIVCIVAWGVAVIIAGGAVMLSPGAVTMWAWMVILMLVLGGAADMFSAALRTAILQQSAAEHVQGRIQGVYIVVVVGGPRLADVLHGWAAGPFGVGLATLLGGVLVVVGTLLCAVFVPSFTNYLRPGPRTVDADPVTD
ncbi:MFS-type transporter involved in bile tolerance, Atg22 family [Corynebacterium pollutisoli]|uniref:Multidrug efflux pump Tap n=1 Tax=Corynebacterium pollutisoli TaxID=1610489 RepID=A0A1X7IPQ3_9CORY|nr:MFS transporter [Corynebacterium pollutisoli]NLP40444.1 MFS transporter [Corynebacterium pollutisoli]SMG16739.1 MFS-type transporter involved in bile tolerance, Atg22 family [Corynebacterium pollutisoli]HJD78077.1 MFS transporter [Corynebacterium pollutisoli]